MVTERPEQLLHPLNPFPCQAGAPRLSPCPRAACRSWGGRGSRALQHRRAQEQPQLPGTCWQTRQWCCRAGERPNRAGITRHTDKEPLLGWHVLWHREKGRGARVPRGVTASPCPQLKEGATAVLSPHVLSAEDEDSPAEEVTFSIQPPANGKVVLRSEPSSELQRFTQAQIDNGLILFVHQGRAGLRCPRSPAPPQGDGDHRGC